MKRPGSGRAGIILVGFGLCLCLQCGSGAHRVVGGGSAGGPMKLYRDKVAGFVLELPRDWSVYPMGPNAVVSLLARSPREYAGDFRENVNLLRLDFPRNFSAKEVQAAHLREIAGRYPGLTILEEGLLQRGSGTVPYVVIDLSVDGLPLKDKIFYFVEGKEGMVLTCSARRETFPRYEGIFDRIAASFRSVGEN